MKKFIFSVSMALFAVAGLIGTNLSEKAGRNGDTGIDNLEALSDPENEKAVVVCEGSCKCKCAEGINFIIHGHAKFIKV